MRGQPGHREASARNQREEELRGRRAIPFVRVVGIVRASDGQPARDDVVSQGLSGWRTRIPQDDNFAVICREAERGGEDG